MMFQRRPTAHMKLLPSDLEVSEARFKRFLKDLHTYEQRLAFERTLDAFLDVYSSWKKTHHETLKLRLVMLAFELHRLDREFQCDLSFADTPA
ncbi:MAG: hypothetical protein HY353_05530 [Candidatus Omnitrophica bacterium]|nr:hypothetical protein [Candidatus Omnitrophota bacterium]